MGPRLNFPLPSYESVAVGMVKVGPTPRITALGLAGDRKGEGLMSPGLILARRDGREARRLHRRRHQGEQRRCQ